MRVTHCITFKYDGKHSVLPGGQFLWGDKIIQGVPTSDGLRVVVLQYTFKELCKPTCQLKREAQSQRSQLFRASEPLIIDCDVDRHVAIVELEGQAGGRVVPRPLYAGRLVRVEIMDEADKVVRHVSRAERVEEVASMELGSVRM